MSTGGFSGDDKTPADRVTGRGVGVDGHWAGGWRSKRGAACVWVRGWGMQGRVVVEANL